MNRQKQNNGKKGFDNFIRYSNLGFEMAAIVAIGTFGGYKLDLWMKNDFKAFTFGLMILSVILSIIYGVRILLKK
jgi:hypothetical protein